MNIGLGAVVVCCLGVAACMEVPEPGDPGHEDGGLPLLLPLPPPPAVSVQGGCHGADAAAAWEGVPGGTPGYDGGVLGAGESGEPLLAEAGGGVPATPTASGQVLISEFMADPRALSDTDGEWFELHNPGPQLLELGGCEIAEGVGPGANIEGPLGIAPLGNVVLSRRPGPGFAPSAVVSFSLKNSEDSLVLRCAGVEIDRVDYGPGFPLAAGASTQRDPGVMAAGDGQGGADDWCLASEPYGADLGTPGAPNAPCWPPEPDSDAGVP